MADLDGIELHDAVIKSFNIDYAKQTAIVELEYYETEADRHRKPAAILFEGVASVSHIANLDELADNASAGNVCYWKPASGPGETYIYLLEGCTVVQAQAVELEARA